MHHNDLMFNMLETIPVCTKDNGVCGYISLQQLVRQQILQLKQMEGRITDLFKLDHFDFDWHWNSATALLLSILILFLYKYLPITAISSAVILSRIPLVFLTAPCAFFRYVFSLYMFGIFVLFFAGLESQQLLKSSRYSK
jgi:hypothetical protein